MGPEFNGHFEMFYKMFMTQLMQILAPATNIREAYEQSSDEEQAFIQNLALFLTGFFRVSPRYCSCLCCCYRWCYCRCHGCRCRSPRTTANHLSPHPASRTLTTYLLPPLPPLHCQAHIGLLETSSEASQAALQGGLEYLVSISFVDETEVFKTCLDYWNYFVPDLYSTSLVEPNAQFCFGGPASVGTGRKELYKGLLSKLRNLMICRMAKPEEVRPQC